MVCGGLYRPCWGLVVASLFSAFGVRSSGVHGVGRMARTQVFRGLGAAVAPGGTLLIVGHHPSDLNTAAKRPSRAELLFTPESVADLFDARDWGQVISEVRPRIVQAEDGTNITVQDSLFRACRPDR